MFKFIILRNNTYILKVVVVEIEMMQNNSYLQMRAESRAEWANLAIFSKIQAVSCSRLKNYSAGYTSQPMRQR